MDRKKSTRRKSRKTSQSPRPTNAKLYTRVKSEAKRKFNVWPSAYASGWVVKEYKRRGGKYYGAKPSKSSGLTRWFKEEWINVCKLPRKVACGRPSTNIRDWKKKYPYCRPSRKIAKGTPKIASELTATEIRSRCKRKKSNPSKRVLARKRSRRRKSKKKYRRRKSKKKSRRRKSKKKSRRRKSTKRSRRRKSSPKRSRRRKSSPKRSRRRKSKKKSRRRKSKKKSRRRKSTKKSRRRKN